MSSPRDEPTSASRSRRRKRGNGEGTISKRSDGRYTAAIYVTRPDGARGRKWIYGTTRAEVAGKLAQLAQRVETGMVIPTRSPTVSDYLTSWLREVAEPKLRPTTLAKYRTAIELYLRPNLGRHRLDKLSVATVQHLLNARRTAVAPVATLRTIREVLSSALGRAVREELVPRNVAQLTTLPVEHRNRRTAWTAAQARSFLHAATDDPAYPVFMLAVVYGMRRSEIAALLWDDIDFTTGRLAVRASLVRPGGRLVRGPVKTAAGVRVLPLVPLTRTALLAQRGSRQNSARPPVLAGPTPATPSPPQRAPGRAAQPVALLRPDRHHRWSAPHRVPRPATDHRDAAQYLGVPARDAQMILDHANIAVTLGIYSEVFDTEIASALARVNPGIS